MTTRPPLMLGSASERRRRLLSDLNIPFDICVPQVEELSLADPREMALKNAQLKNDWCRAEHPEHHIITADTIVIFEQRAVEKPTSMDQAIEFLSMFSGKKQTVITAVALATPKSMPTLVSIESEVVFKELSPDIITAYFAHVDPMDKAGAYDIGQDGELIIASYSGSYTNIVGLPMETVQEWLQQEGILSQKAD
jgi:septum formation protein